MTEQEVKEYVADALSQVAADADVRIVRRGILLEFVDGDRFLLPTPIDVSDTGTDPEDSGDDDEELSSGDDEVGYFDEDD
jgi:hypothetical protein